MMKDGRWVKRWMVTSESSDKLYCVGQDKDGEYGCSCPGWTRHTPRRDCKHVLRVQNIIKRDESHLHWDGPKWGVYTLEEYTLARMAGKL